METSGLGAAQVCAGVGGRGAGAPVPQHPGQQQRGAQRHQPLLTRGSLGCGVFKGFTSRKAGAPWPAAARSPATPTPTDARPRGCEGFQGFHLPGSWVPPGQQQRRAQQHQPLLTRGSLGCGVFKGFASRKAGAPWPAAAQCPATPTPTDARPRGCGVFQRVLPARELLPPG